ncbi:MAG TPA: hypothetical protein VI729_00480 [Anaerolineales bacterium]|nr:hypothetical protein [Anaerolineales bacterium]
MKVILGWFEGGVGSRRRRVVFASRECHWLRDDSPDGHGSVAGLHLDDVKEIEIALWVDLEGVVPCVVVLPCPVEGQGIELQEAESIVSPHTE